MFHASVAAVFFAASVMMTAMPSEMVEAPPGGGYREPDASLVRLVEAAPTPMVSLSPTRDMMLLLHRVSLPPVADLARPMLRLAGMRIDPSTNGPHGPRRTVGLALRALDGSERPVALPVDADISGVTWSADGKHVAFTMTTPTGIQGWVLAVATGTARAVTPATLNPLGGPALRWLPDGRTLLARVVASDRGPIPARPAAPAGPTTHVADGSTAPLRTLQDMLSDEHDARVFEHLATSRLALVAVDGGAGGLPEMRFIGAPAIYTTAAPSPDGRYLLVSRTVRPFSYQVGWGDFPEIVEVWDLNGRVVREVARVPLRENIPIEGVETGPRGFQWQDSAEARLFWVEALDGGDPKKKVEHRDRLMRLNAPFAGSAEEVWKVEHRFTGLDWLESWGGRAPATGLREGMALVTEYDRDRRWTRSTLIMPGEAAVAPKVVFDRSIRDRYNDPGRPLTRPDARGRALVLVEGGSLYLRGAGASPKGERPFLDRLSLVDGTKERVWQCDEESYESVVDIARWGGGRPGAVITSRESVAEPPNYLWRDLTDGSRKALTAFTDPTPELRGIRKQLVTYARADGVPLSATLYLPPGYQAGTRLPLLVWAYPREFNDAATAGQVSGSDKRFVRIGGISHLFLLMAGYAVMDEASMPVVGDPETMNDTFVTQIVSSARAAIDKAVEMGVADPERVAVGGHSYGAFMTANLLAHCDYFKAGIARSGAYNRTLTPFGFQSERRTFWEAREVYMNLSPFTHAHKIKTPLLMFHGERDNNSGTFPMQSERLFQAIKGNGGVARLVMLPEESHGYQARESVLHVLAETIEWLDRYVKNHSSAAR